MNQFRQAQYWILEAVVEGLHPLANLRGDVVEVAFNRKGHGLELDDLCAALDDLLQRQLIYIERAAPPELQGRCITPDKIAIKTLLLNSDLYDPDWVWYGLTTAGGRYWDRASEPEWDKYATGGLNTMTGECNAASATRQLVIDYLAQVNQYATRRASNQITLSDLQWIDISDWPATYWKTLPIGHQVSFVISDPEDDDFPLIEDILGSWYKIPALSD